MHSTFERLMADATRLTRAGNLGAATAAIQAALRGAMRPVDDDACVIDVEAREIRSEREIERNAESIPPRPAGDAGRFIAGSHTHAAGMRDYKLYVPPGYRGQPLPLVVMLHGCTQDPDDFAAGTRMNEAALGRDFFVLYPAQAQKANPSRCWNWFKHNHQRRDRGEPALLADMTQCVSRRYGIDARRVYVAGLSAGGAMAAILGSAYPDVFAAVGVHSGLPAGSATNAKTAFEAMRRGAESGVAPSGHAPPTIVFHGDQDTTVHPVNGQHVVAARAGAATSERERGRSENGREYTRNVYRDADGRVVAEHWVVHGAGHAWSGGSPRGSYTDAKGPDATEQMLRFFFTHRS
jgi:poly(hydroxyalkanoate) depolymerase family esterase